jgi:hypothetical protein
MRQASGEGVYAVVWTVVTKNANVTARAIGTRFLLLVAGLDVASEARHSAKSIVAGAQDFIQGGLGLHKPAIMASSWTALDKF